MVRSAFAPLIKFSGLTESFDQLSEELEMEEELTSDIEDKREKEQKILQALKKNKQYEYIVKRYAVASRMRTWYQEVKKNISEALEKRRHKEQLLKQQEGKPIEEDEEGEQIDTSGPTLTKTMSEEDTAKLDRDMENVTMRLAEKAELLIKLCIPPEWEQPKEGEDQEIMLMRTTSEIAEQK